MLKITTLYSISEPQEHSLSTSEETYLFDGMWITEVKRITFGEQDEDEPAVVG